MCGEVIGHGDTCMLHTGCDCGPEDYQEGGCCFKEENIMEN